MNTTETSSDQPRKKAVSESWPLKLNKALIAIGVIAFGLIVTDRLLEAFRADDAPATAGISAETPDENTDQVVVEINPSDRESLAELQSLIGSRVVFVSATGSGYVVTEDDRRISVGDAVNEDIILSKVTTHQVILEKADDPEDLMIYELPDPVVQ